MLEEIHDIAPNASLAFATAYPTPEISRTTLPNWCPGCKVIVDDVGYFNEPDFQSGIIDQAIIDAVENHGVTYFFREERVFWWLSEHFAALGHRY